VEERSSCSGSRRRHPGQGRVPNTQGRQLSLSLVLSEMQEYVLSSSPSDTSPRPSLSGTGPAQGQCSAQGPGKKGLPPDPVSSPCCDQADALGLGVVGGILELELFIAPSLHPRPGDNRWTSSLS
jgi:hypothetical protein